MHVRKPPKHALPPDFGPWTTACFLTQEARDRFLQVATSLPEGDVEVEPKPDDYCTAAVRWRPGKFLSLNDMAYAHGGNIRVGDRRRP